MVSVGVASLTVSAEHSGHSKRYCLTIVSIVTLTGQTLTGPHFGQIATNLSGMNGA